MKKSKTKKLVSILFIILFVLMIGATNTYADQHTSDEIVKEGQDFINLGKEATTTTIDGKNLIAGSNTIYNILLAVGVVVAVLIGAYLGVKFMASSAEDKAKVKESLIPYVAGCIIIFGAFTIWKIVIIFLSGMES